MSEPKSPWGIDNLKEQVKELNEKQIQELQQKFVYYAQCFSTPAGKQVLADLERLLNDRPTWNPMKSKKHGYYREGQNDVLKFIINRVNIVRIK